MADASEIMSVRLKAEAGDPRSQFALAHASFLGREVPHAPADAMRLLNAACRKNYPEALLLRGVLSILGLHTPRNYEEAYSYLAQAAATGNANAKGMAAVLGDGKGGFNLDPWRAQPQATQHFNSPRIFTFKNFIPKAACDWLIRQNEADLRPAVTYTAQGLTQDPNRSNRGVTPQILNLDLVSHMVNLRISAATGTPLLNQEPSSFLNYAVGEEYRPHYDFIFESHTPAPGELRSMGQRIGTFLIYLNGGYQGGETEFTRLNWRFKGEPGDALFFFNVSARGELESLSQHAGLPVTEGEKWLLSKWIRADQVPLGWQGNA